MACSQGTFQRRSSRDGRLASSFLRESASAPGSHGPYRAETLSLAAGSRSSRRSARETSLSCSTAATCQGSPTGSRTRKGRILRGVFRVQDSLLRISGEGDGYIGTRGTYRDYHLIVEYKWGKRTDGGKFVRNSGILLHATGPDGGAGGTWMSSIECQLAQGCVGDLIPIRGQDEAGGDIPVRRQPQTLGRAVQATWTHGARSWRHDRRQAARRRDRDGSRVRGHCAARSTTPGSRTTATPLVTRIVAQTSARSTTTSCSGSSPSPAVRSRSAARIRAYAPLFPAFLRVFHSN